MDHPQPVQHTMANTHRVASPKTSNPLASTRSPLSNRANIRVDAVHADADTTTNTNINTTINANWDHKDSSEGQPSTHASICDAAWLSTSDLAKSPYQTPGRPTTPLRAIDLDLESESPLSRLETPFLYGYGTELAPILEQRSIATLRTIGSRSTSDLSSLLHDAPGGGGSGGGGSSSSSKKSHSKSDTTTQSRPLHRQHCFGLHDAVSRTQANQRLAESGPQLRCLSYVRPTVHIVDVHAYPRKPIYPPPQRPATPPTLRRIARPRSEGDAYVASASSGVAYEEPGFRPPRSGHGNLSAHPFVSQTTATPAHSSARARRRGTLGGARDPTRAVPDSIHVAQTASRHGTFSSFRTRYLAPPETRGGACRKCGHPRSEWWSLGSTLMGHGPGMRRGADWCSRCACRKIVHGYCCGD
ncbi:hypothetical protein F5Y14DRAFT_74998 [Nemania sp. NC0429]|nr:hypothetical protein F5Y14DRAFT_74998 [Nemania sp. NC0429]